MIFSFFDRQTTAARLKEMRVIAVLSLFILLSLLLAVVLLPIFGDCQAYRCMVAAVKNLPFPNSGSPIAAAGLYLNAVLNAGSAFFSADRLFAFLLCLAFLAFAAELKARLLCRRTKLRGASDSAKEANESVFAWLALHENSPTRNWA